MPVLYRTLRDHGLATHIAAAKIGLVLAAVESGDTIPDAWAHPYTVCGTTGRPASNGVCSLHGTTTCLHSYAPVAAPADLAQHRDTSGTLRRLLATVRRIVPRLAAG